MQIHIRWIMLAGCSVLMGAGLLSCKKMVTVPLPINSITSDEMFRTDAQALTSMAGVYTQMVNGALSFTNGYVTILAGMSADELYYFGTTTDPYITTFTPNQLIRSNSYTATLWTGAYKTIYYANSIIEGIAASESSALTDSMRTRLTGEAKLVRAFCYFYLVNVFGDVPLVKTVDFNKTSYMSRTPASEIYDAIIADLKDAQDALTADYSTTGTAERIFPTKWAATALLARVYLYKGEFANAAEQATAVINNTSLFGLEADPNNVFLIKSREAIWQLKQGTTDATYKNATTEGYSFNPNSSTGISRYGLMNELLNSFETGDRRRTAWVNRTTTAASGYIYYPYKYKTGHASQTTNPSTEYYMMLRLGELYLLRAEAAANGAGGGVAAAIADLNVIRNRAGLPDLATTLTQAQVIAAIAHERQTELFAEWGHRWFDLKRTGKAHDVLSAMSSKQPWAGDFQLVYPIPPTEIQVNPRLEQNPEY